MSHVLLSQVLVGRGEFGSRRFCFGCNGSGGVGVVRGGVVERGVVEQGHASLLCLALGAGRIRACLADCWSESFGCGGPTLASELGQSQLPDVLQKPASKGNSSTIATPLKQCQTQLSDVIRLGEDITCRCLRKWCRMHIFVKSLAYSFSDFAS